MTDRTDKSIRNIKYALIGQILNQITTFIARAIFLNILGTIFLGIDGVFGNILNILSLAELGIGPALIFALYEPLVKNDKEKIKQIMHLYKISYVTIGVIIILGGLLFSPFLGYFINESVPNTNLFIAFMLFVLTTAVTYFYSYKSSLLIADQKRYIVVKYQFTFSLLITIIQTIVLWITKDYILYLITRLIITFIEHFALYKKSDKVYPYLCEPIKGKLDVDTKNSITKNIKAVVIHKIGAVMIFSTDNLIISRMLGVVIVGIYSNYVLITAALKSLIGQVFYSLVATVGNLRVSESKERAMEIFDVVYFLGFWIFGFCCICLVCLFNPFISLFFGNDLIFNMPIVLAIVFSFYLTSMRSPVTTFKEAYGLYWQNRFVPIFEITINLVTSVILCYYFGLIGVFIGTIISTLTTCFWIEPYVLFKHGFDKSFYSYMLTYIKYTGITIGVGVLCYYLCSFFPNNIIGFVVKAFICLIFINCCFVIIFRHTKQYLALKEIIMRKLLKRNVI